MFFLATAHSVRHVFTNVFFLSLKLMMNLTAHLKRMEEQVKLHKTKFDKNCSDFCGCLKSTVTMNLPDKKNLTVCVKQTVTIQSQSD